MKFKGKIIGISKDFTGGEVLTISTSNLNDKAYELIDKEQEITIENERKQRSNSANALFWEYIGKLQNALNIPKEELYQEYIRRCGIYEVVSVLTTAKDNFINVWKSNGLGFLVEEVEEQNGFTMLLCYRGTSTYSTKEMSYLINQVAEDLTELGIETKPKEYVDSLLKEMEKKK